MEEAATFLRSQPQFEQMRQAIQDNPHLFSALLHQIKETNPALYQAISGNQEQFVQLLNEDSGSTGGNGGARVGIALRLPGPCKLQDRLSPQDKEAIDRLCLASGISIYEVIQVYIASDKNENLAANILQQQ